MSTRSNQPTTNNQRTMNTTTRFNTVLNTTKLVAALKAKGVAPKQYAQDLIMPDTFAARAIIEEFGATGFDPYDFTGRDGAVWLCVPKAFYPVAPQHRIMELEERFLKSGPTAL